MTTLRLVTPPTAEAVTLAEAKAHLNVDFADDDALIAAYIAAAIERLDYLNRSLRPTGWALDLGRFEDELLLPKPPLTSVDAITYLDPSNTIQMLSDSIYELKTDALGQGVLRLKYGRQWPELSEAKEPISIAFTAGYQTLPGPIRAAVLLTVGALYEQRAEVTGAPVFALPFGVDALLATYRVWTS